MESVELCLKLTNGKVSDSLGVCRSLLENYMLFMLMCRGRKYVIVNDLSSPTPEKFSESPPLNRITTGMKVKSGVRAEPPPRTPR